MPKSRITQVNFRRALQTTHSRDGLPLGEYVQFLNGRVNRQSATRRPGTRVVQLLDDVQPDIALFTNSPDTHLVAPAASQHELGVTWSVRFIASPDFTVATAMIVGWDDADYPINIIANNADQIVVQVQDSAGTVVTLTAAIPGVAGDVIGGMVTRNRGDLTLWLDGAVADTGTMDPDLKCKAPSTPMVIGWQYDGTIEVVTFLSTWTAPENDFLLRFPDPRASYVLADYHLLQGFAVYEDRSRYGNHAKQGGTQLPGTEASSAYPYAPVQSLFPYKNRQGEGRIAALVGGEMTLGSIE